MKKLINGTIVDIKNIDMFIRAAKGIGLNRKVTNALPAEKLDISSLKNIDKYIDAYKEFYSKLPYPLNGLDDNIKYHAAGLFIKKQCKTNTNMFVDNRALFIVLNEEKKLALEFINFTWGITYVDNLIPDNIDISKYQEDSCFDEFVYVLVSMFKDEDTKQFYIKFIPEILQACKKNSTLFNWELINMLKFGTVPDKKALTNNIILDVENNKQYVMDIYYLGKKELTNNSDDIADIENPLLGLNLSVIIDTKSNKIKIHSERDKTINIYNYELYEKDVPEDEIDETQHTKLKKETGLYGVRTLFNSLTSIKANSASNLFEDYKAIIIENKLVYEINHRIFICELDKLGDYTEIARGAEIYSYSDDYKLVYFSKSKKITETFIEQTIYSVDLKDNTVRLCEIKYI